MNASGHDRGRKQAGGRALARGAAVVLVAAALGACGALSIFRSEPRAALEEVRVIAEAGANENTATALDLVFVYDAAAVETLPQTGPAWFAARAGVRSAWPKAIDVVSLEVPPAHVVPSVALPRRYRSAVRVLAYANYLAEAGQYPMNLTAFERAVIRLRRASIEITDE